MKPIKFITAILTMMVCLINSQAQNKTSQINDSNTPMYLLPPDYPMPYGPPKAEDVVNAIDRIYNYLNANTPARLQNKITKTEITDFSKPDTNAVVEPGTFRLTSYEWGVTYGAMLRATEITKNPKYLEYTQTRLDFLNKSFDYYKILWNKGYKDQNPFARVLEPKALDDCGSVCNAFIKLQRSEKQKNFTPIINIGIDFVMNKEHRLADKTIARMRPQANTMWLDDMYMGIPCLAQMGALTGETKYYDEAAFQVLKFGEKMFVRETGLFRHGWVEEMSEHPAFHWGRANGWAVLTMCEVLDVLPENHKDRAQILELFRAHCKGIAKYQGQNGFWHQLMDRNDSYEETSATAIFTYCLAHGINKGWLDPMAYGPQAILGWNALSTKINAQGQVEGTCVGTGMGFDPAFYYYRPVRALAAHGYGPTLLAGSEILLLLKNYQIVINETSVMLYKQGVDWNNLKIK
jgi:unsaturated rhamnogalacturonyl hydrolase